MSQFIESYHYEKISTRKYRLLVDISYQTHIKGRDEQTKFGQLRTDGRLILYRGFVWDGATGAIDTDSVMRASAVHDWFCTNVANRRLPVKFRRLGDDIFKDIMIEDDVPMWRVHYAHFAVVAYGKMVVARLNIT